MLLQYFTYYYERTESAGLKVYNSAYMSQCDFYINVLLAINESAGLQFVIRLIFSPCSSETGQTKPFYACCPPAPSILILLPSPST